MHRYIRATPTTTTTNIHQPPFWRKRTRNKKERKENEKIKKQWKDEPTIDHRQK